MPITIDGIKVNGVHIKPDDENGGFKIDTAEYALIGSTGKILAKQTIGGYGGLVLEASPKTKKAMEEFMAGYVEDVKTTLGLG